MESKMGKRKRPEDFDIFGQVVQTRVKLENKYKTLKPWFETWDAQQLE